MNSIKAYVLYLLCLLAALTDNKKMQSWLERVINELPT